MKTYYVAQVRGASLDDLEKKGFLVIKPHVDDYVFLEVGEKDTLLGKEESLRIKFLRHAKGYVRVDELVVEGFGKGIKEDLGVGTKIRVVGGLYKNLDGTVTALTEGGYLVCSLEVYNRLIEVELDPTLLLKADEAGEEEDDEET